MKKKNCSLKRGFRKNTVGSHIFIVPFIYILHMMFWLHAGAQLSPCQWHYDQRALDFLTEVKRKRE